MIHFQSREIDKLAELFGADAWVLVRSGRHLVIDFTFEDGVLRQIFSCTPSCRRAGLNQRATMRRHLRVVQ